MWATLLSFIIPIALKGIEWYLNSVNASNELKKRFFEFAEQMANEYLNSVRLRDSYKEQLEALKKKVQDGSNT